MARQETAYPPPSFAGPKLFILPSFAGPKLFILPSLAGEVGAKRSEGGTKVKVCLARAKRLLTFPPLPLPLSARLDTGLRRYDGVFGSYQY